MGKLYLLAVPLLSASLWAAPNLGDLNGVIFSGAAHWRSFEFSSGNLKNCESTPPGSKDFQICQVEGATLHFSDGSQISNPFAGAAKLVYKRGPGGTYEVFTFLGKMVIPMGNETMETPYQVTFSVEPSEKKEGLTGNVTVGGERSALLAKRR